jgi:POT family proton-dependent oligopeptide transporter
LTWMYVGFSIMCFGTGVVFWWLFRGYDRPKEEGLALRNLDGDRLD